MAPNIFKFFRPRKGQPLAREGLAEFLEASRHAWNTLNVEGGSVTWTHGTPTISGGGGGVSGDKWAFGYELVSVDGVPSVNINAGSVRMHGLRVYTYTPPEEGSELPLVGDDCIVFIEIDRTSALNTITLSAQTVMTASTATTLRIPLYTFEKPSGGTYALKIIHNMGDVNIDQPIR